MISRTSTTLTSSSRNLEDVKTRSLLSNISFHRSLLSNSQSLDSQSLMILPLLLKQRLKPSAMQLLLLLTHTVRLLLMLQQPWLVQFRQIVTLWMHSINSSSLTWMPATFPRTTSSTPSSRSGSELWPLSGHPSICPPTILSKAWQASSSWH